MDLPSLTADCEKCAALCCVAFFFDKGEMFAEDKVAGIPCRHLGPGHLCKIHSDLDARGYRGCARYDCAGAGQRVTQDLFAGRSWRDDPDLLGPMMEAFGGMRLVHDHLQVLDQLRGMSLPAGEAGTCSRLLTRLSELGDPTSYPGSAFNSEVKAFLSSLRDVIASDDRPG